MWINLDPKELEVIDSALYRLMASTAHDEAKAVRDKITEWEKDARSDLHKAYRDAAFMNHHRDGELEIDHESDGTCMVSKGDDPGAYVMAWVWVDNSEAGVDNICRTCGEPYKEGGDGWDGECPDCADKTDQKLHPENYE